VILILPTIPFALTLIIFGAALLLVPQSRWRPLVLWPIYGVAVAAMTVIGPALDVRGPGRLQFAEWFAPLFALIWVGVALWRSPGSLLRMRRVAAIGIWAMTLVPGMALVGLAVACANGNCI
jgi:hypothetical protein